MRAENIQLGDALVDSSSAGVRNLPESDRRLRVPGMTYPISLEEPEAIQRALCKAQQGIGRAPGAKGSGNKRIRLCLQLPHGRAPSASELESKLAGSATRVQERGWWALLANPKVYDIEAAVESDRIDNWVTDGRRIAVGDRVLVWKARGRGTRRGVVAAGEVVVGPRVLSDENNPFWLKSAKSADAQERVGIRYETDGFPLWLDEHPWLEELSVARARGGTVFRLTSAQFNRTRQLATPTRVHGAGGAGRPYVLADEEVIVSAAEAHSPDPDRTQAGWRAHARTQNALAEFLRTAGFDPRSPDGEPEYDLFWHAPSGGVVAEVKSIATGNEEKQLRLGLGQVVRYREQLRAKLGGSIGAVLVVDQKPSDVTWCATCESVGVRLTWSEVFGELLACTRVEPDAPDDMFDWSELEKICQDDLRSGLAWLRSCHLRSPLFCAPRLNP